ncbi:MAG TPA: 3'-5' exonuclease, partial [Actinopolymorphaceae bacterium]|nr:3'-5' exonuclease [Actinopolymorphaceae bacterium]
HNRARRHFVRAVLDALTRQAVVRLGEDFLERAEIAEIRAELRSAPAVRDLMDQLWPELTPHQLLTELYTSADRLAVVAPELSEAERQALERPASHPWTTADVPLLDEAAELLGPLDATVYAASDAAAQRTDIEEEELAYAREMVELQVESEQLDGVMPWDVDDLAAGVAGRYRENRRGGPLADSALEDREWVYGHIIVDEAQELSAMAWRMLVRRCPARSMTVVGDVAQASAPGGVRSWAEALDPYAEGRWRRARLSVNYRTPREIMAVANDVLAGIDADLEPPRSVRTGTQPWTRRIEPTDLTRELPDIVAAEAAEIADPGEGGEPSGGRVAVVVPAARLDEVVGMLAPLTPGTAAAGDASVLDAQVAVLTVAQAKGLEFDAVIVVDPAGLLAESARGPGDLYVALTRATRRLGIITLGPLPDLLSRLAEAPGPHAPGRP